LPPPSVSQTRPRPVYDGASRSLHRAECPERRIPFPRKRKLTHKNLVLVQYLCSSARQCQEHMDAIETNFRSRPRNPLAIRHYVQSLVDARRILEAAFYFNILQKNDPLSISTNKLGYLIAIMRLDNKVLDYDKALSNGGASKEDIFSLRLAYYIAFSKSDLALEIAKFLAPIKIKNDLGMSGMIQIIEETGDYGLTKLFIDNQYRRITATPRLDQILKKILISKFLGVISEIQQK
jgi:hypothetical protein